MYLPLSYNFPYGLLLLKRLTRENRAVERLPPGLASEEPGRLPPYPEWPLRPPLQAPAARCSHLVVSPWPSAVATAMAVLLLHPSPCSSGGWLLFQGHIGVLPPGTVVLSPAQGSQEESPPLGSFQAEVRPDTPARESWPWRVRWCPQHSLPPCRS